MAFGFWMGHDGDKEQKIHWFVQFLMAFEFWMGHDGDWRQRTKDPVFPYFLLPDK
jgi:hypothetical protein